MSRKELLLYSLFTMFYFDGCGGEADYSFSDVSPIQSGKFIDNAVEGLEYAALMVRQMSLPEAAVIVIKQGTFSRFMLEH